MHKKEIVKHVIDKYIDKGKDFFELTPGYLSQLQELKGFSERTLKRGRTEYKAENKKKLKHHSKTTASARKKIYSYLSKKPDATPKVISEAFPEYDMKLIANSRKLWRSEKIGTTTISRKNKSTRTRKPYNTIKKRVFEYLESNPDNSLEQLRAVFPKAKDGVLDRLYELWASDQTSLSASSTVGLESGNSVNPDEMIKALLSTIETQKSTIEALKSQNELLKNSQNPVFPELVELGAEEMKSVENVVRTFIRGVKNN